MPVANFVESVTIYDDVENASNPQRKHVDWKRSASALSFEQAYSERFLLAPGTSRTIQAAVGLTDLSATPVTFGVPSAQPTWYQVRGSFPSSPWALALSVGAQSITVTANTLDSTALVTGTGLAALTNVKPGDWVYLGGSTYGDASNFSAANQGFWAVTAVGAGIYLSRVYGTDPAPVTETVATVGTLDVQHIPNATRPRWVYISGSPAFAGIKSVVAAASGWVAITAESQFVPTGPVTLTALAVTPTYIAYVRVESDQPVTLTVGDVVASPNAVTLLPVKDGSPAWYEAFSFATSLVVTNAGSVAAIINSIHATTKSES